MAGPGVSVIVLEPKRGGRRDQQGGLWAQGGELGSAPDYGTGVSRKGHLE